MHGLPEAFIARMASRLGDELPQFLQAMDEPYKRGIRIRHQTVRSNDIDSCIAKR